MDILSKIWDSKPNRLRRCFVNLANRLTLARIILIPLFMAFLLLQIPKGHTYFHIKTLLLRSFFGRPRLRMDWMVILHESASNGSGKIYGSAGR